MTRRVLLAAGTLTVAVLLSGCAGGGHQKVAPPASGTTAPAGTTGTTATTGTGMSDQEISELEKIVSGAETAANQAADSPG
jgi:hypothetical protein